MQGEVQHFLLFRRQTGKFNVLNIHRQFPLVLITEVDSKHFVLVVDALLDCAAEEKKFNIWAESLRGCPLLSNEIHNIHPDSSSAYCVLFLCQVRICPPQYACYCSRILRQNVSLVTKYLRVQRSNILNGI